MGHRLASHTREHIMRFFVALSALVAVGLAADEPVYLSSLYHGAGVYAGAYAAPVAAPVAHAYAPYYAPGSQFHAQDEFGNPNYGYANINSVKQEVGNTYGGVNGGYSYVDAAGVLQTVRYVADGLGFRVEDSRLPVAPEFNAELPVAPVYDGVAPTFNPEPLVAPVFTGVAPEPVAETPEVLAARAEHAAAHAAISKREADPAFVGGHTSVSQPLSAPHLIHNPSVRAVVAAPAVGYAGYHGLGLGHAGLGYHGLGLGYAGYHGLGYAGYHGLAHL